MVLLLDDPFSLLTPPCLCFFPLRKKKLVGRPSLFLLCIFASPLPDRPPGSMQLLRIAVQKWRWQSRGKNPKFRLCFSIQIGKFLLLVAWLILGFLAGGHFWQGIKRAAHAFKPELNQDLPWRLFFWSWDLSLHWRRWDVPKSQGNSW